MRKEYPSEFENEINRRYTEQRQLELKKQKETQLEVDKLVGHRKKST